MSISDTEVSTPIENKEEAQDFEWIDLSDLYDDTENLRENYDGIEDLAASIKAHGLKQPIVCYRDEEGRYIIEAGHRRKRALVLAGEKRTRVIVSRKKPLPEERIATMLIENGHRKDLNPIEQAYGLEKIRQSLGVMRETKVSDRELGEYIGRTQVWVTDRVRLLNLSPGDQQRVREGRMTMKEGVRVGRVNAGNVRPGAIGKKGAGFFVSSHPLAQNAANRCNALNHKSGGPNWVAIACGPCWEHVIRADERKKNQMEAREHGHCGTCGQVVDTVQVASPE